MMTEQDTRKAFRDAEANLRLEGLDPSGRPHYEEIKARVIAGEITVAQARQEMAQYHQRLRASLTP